MTATRTLRRKAGLTMQDLADAVGISRQTVSAWEIEDAWPNAELLPAIAAALGCSIDDLYRTPDNNDFTTEVGQ